MQGKLELFDRNLSLSERAFVFLFCIIWTRFPLVDFARILFMHIPVIGGSNEQYFVPVLTTVVAILAIPFMKERLNGKQYTFVLFFYCLYFIHYLIFSENRVSMGKLAPEVLLGTVPCFLVGAVGGFKKYKKTLYYLSVLSLLLQLWFTFGYSVSNADNLNNIEDAHYMTAAYGVLPHACFLFCLVFEEYSIYKLFYTLLGASLLISFGTRGPMVCYLFFIAVYLLSNKLQSLKSFTKILFAFFFAAIAFSYKYVLVFLYPIMSQIPGVSTRFYNLAVDGELGYTWDRDEIKHILYSHLAENPVFGCGIGADRTILHEGYAHSIITEFVLDYGYVFGVVALMLVIIFIVRCLNYCVGFNKSLLLIIVSCALGTLFSGSYLVNSFFWLALGYSSYIKCTFNTIDGLSVGQEYGNQ